MQIFSTLKKIVRNFLPDSLISFYHFVLAYLSALIYGFPSHQLCVIGVTGTKGKTTVTELLTAILESSGKKVALANGLRFKIGDNETPNLFKMTMPGRGRLQKFLSEARKSGCSYAVLEVTSEGIRQHRNAFIRFAIASLTNVQKEHLESHGSFDAYRAEKGKFFREVGDTHVINAEDPNAEYFGRFPAKKKIFYSLKDAERLKLKPRIWGEFNIMNAVCAATIAETLGIPVEKIRKAVSDFRGTPGRMESMQREPFTVIVDYAHTPDSLESVYRAIRDNIKPAHMVCLLGAAGNRDKWKRPVMGGIAAQYCDLIFLADEDPYDENPAEILNEIKSGIPNAKIKQTNVVPDRKKAIGEAIKSAGAGDAVIITGKGAEQYMIVGSKKIPWDDREVVRQELRKMVKSH